MLTIIYLQEKLLNDNFMKNILCLIVYISFLANSANSQNYQFSLGTNYLRLDNSNTTNTLYSGGSDKFIQKYIEPYLGCHYKVYSKRDIWFGIEFGRFGFKNTHYADDPTNNNTSRTFDENSYHIKSTYLSFHLNECYKFKDIKIGLGIQLPFRFYSQREDILYSYSIINGQQNKDYENYYYVLWPRILKYGLWFNQSINKRIYKNLYFGIYIIESIESEKRFGNGKNIIWNKSQGIETSRLEYNTTYKKYLTTQLSIFPAFKLNYYF